MLTVAEETLQRLADEARQAGRHPPLRPGDQPRDLRHLQGRHAAQGRRRERRPHRRRRGMVHALARRFPGARVRLHALQSALRQELEEGPRSAWAARTGCATRASRSMHDGEEFSLVTRSSDGQMLFLANMASQDERTRPPLGSRIAEVHNGSSLFTGDAGQGESNIRRWIIENDWLEAIVALPLNMFYNTGIATYIWVLSNRKPEHRQGKVQLIDATQWFKPLRKNLGKKNCELSPDDIERICDTFLDFEETRAVEDLPQRRLRLLEGHRRAPAAPAQPAHAQGHRVAALRLRRRRPPRRALRRVRRRAFQELRQGLRRVGETPRRMGQRRGRRTTTKRAAAEERSAREEEKEAARRQDLGARRPPRRSRHEAARRNSATSSSRITTSSATAWTLRSRSSTSSSPPPT